MYIFKLKLSEKARGYCMYVFLVKIRKVQKDLKFYVRTRACEKRESGKQP